MDHTTNTYQAIQEHTRHIRRRTRHKKSPLAPPTTLLRQHLQIPHLPNRTTPERKQALMQIIHIGNRPSLKSRGITRHPSKVTIMQPVTHILRACDSRKSQVIVGPRCCCMSFRGSELVILLHEAGAYEEDIADADVAALTFWPEV